MKEPRELSEEDIKDGKEVLDAQVKMGIKSCMVPIETIQNLFATIESLRGEVEKEKKITVGLRKVLLDHLDEGNLLYASRAKLAEAIEPFLKYKIIEETLINRKKQGQKISILEEQFNNLTKIAEGIRKEMG